MPRHKGGGGDHGGGGGHDGSGSMRWLLTYADLITLLMVFFVILYSMSRVDAGKYAGLQRSLSQTFFSGGTLMAVPNTPATGPGGVAPEKDPLEVLGEDIAESLDGLTKAGEVKIIQSERGIVVSLQGTVLYALGDANIRPGSERILEEIARALRRVTNHVAVEGYTDDIPINTVDYPTNWELSTRRATNLVRYLIDREGLPAQRFVAVGYGEYHPLYPNDSAENRAKNRRVDVVILKTVPAANVGREVRPRGH